MLRILTDVRIVAASMGMALLLGAGPAQAGPIFLTGHDPDFHSQDSSNARNLLTAGLQFVTGGTMTSGQKFLWVESFVAPTSGHRVGEDGLNALGLTNGVEYDWVNAAGFASANLTQYDAIAVASSFGGMLTRDELNALIARKTDIANFVNGGGGVLALSECYPASSFCYADTLASSPNLFGFLPVNVTSVATSAPYKLTLAGKAMFPGLTDADMNDPTHNSFGDVGGLTIIDTDTNGVATTLAGNVRIDNGTFTPVPEPGSLMLLGGGLAMLAARRFRAGTR